MQVSKHSRCNQSCMYPNKLSGIIQATCAAAEVLQMWAHTAHTQTLCSSQHLTHHLYHACSQTAKALEQKGNFTIRDFGMMMSAFGSLGHNPGPDFMAAVSHHGPWLCECSFPNLSFPTAHQGTCNTTPVCCGLDSQCVHTSLPAVTTLPQPDCFWWQY